MNTSNEQSVDALTPILNLIALERNGSYNFPMGLDSNATENTKAFERVGSQDVVALERNVSINVVALERNLTIPPHLARVNTDLAAIQAIRRA